MPSVRETGVKKRRKAAPQKPVSGEPATPQTGDNFNAVTFIWLMVLSSFGLAAVMICKKQEEKKESAQ